MSDIDATIKRVESVLYEAVPIDDQPKLNMCYADVEALIAEIARLRGMVECLDDTNESLLKINADCMARIDALEAERERFDKTRDGKTVVAGDPVYSIEACGHLIGELVVNTRLRASGLVQVSQFHHSKVNREKDVSECYSTREAAEQAKEQPNE